MTFKELQEIFELKLGITTLADIARELDVTPQVVSNWKSKNHIPYKYIILLKKNLDEKNLDKVGLRNDKVENFYKEKFENENNYIESFAINIRTLFTIFLKEIKFIVSIIIIICSITLIRLQFFTPSIFKSYAKVLPLLNQSNGVVGLMNSLGFGASRGSSNNDFPSAAIIPDVVKSKLLHERLLYEKYSNSNKDTTMTTLIELLIGKPYDGHDYNNAEKQSALKKVKKLISIYSPNNTSIITIGAKTTDPLLSRELVTKIIENLENIFADHKSQINKEKRLFVKSRIIELNKDLSIAENELKVFSEKNRIIINSPSLILEKSRLERVVQGKMQILVNLKTDYELTKIKELEENKVLLVLDKPAVPIIRDSPRKTRTMLSVIIFSSIFSFIMAFMKNWFKENYTLYIAPVFKNM